MRAPAPRRQYAGSQEGPVGALIGAGRAKKVYEHPTNADAVVVRIASPSDMDLALIEFAQAAHAQRLPMAAHLPRVGNLSRNADGSLSYEAERLAHQQGARSVSLGRDRAVTADGGWYVRGLPEGDPQSASLRATMDAMNRHLQGRVSGRFYAVNWCHGGLFFCFFVFPPSADARKSHCNTRFVPRTLLYALKCQFKYQFGFYATHGTKFFDGIGFYEFIDRQDFFIREARISLSKWL
jgi:hypothetical protein